ncbi:DUF1433 domain-containing protein [Rummeliibacillus sp. BSL5]
MKKIHIYIFISIVIIVGGGWFFLYYHDKQQEKEWYFAKQEQRIEKYLEYNVPKFKMVTFTDKGTVATGLPYIDGYINNDKKLSFTALVEPNDHNFESILGMTDSLNELMNVDIKTYSEIIKEEKNNKK